MPGAAPIYDDLLNSVMPNWGLLSSAGLQGLAAAGGERLDVRVFSFQNLGSRLFSVFLNIFAELDI
jgi:hypothetical protein